MDDISIPVRDPEAAPCAEEQLRQLNETLEARVAAEIESRRKAEAALLRAQKMESLGQLTGGIAHDFNNLLQVISSNLQLLEVEFAGNARAQRRITAALDGVARGSRLASQLLAFGRRQALAPQVLNIGQHIASIEDMLRSAIGSDIRVDVIKAPALWNSFIDPAQLENAILNLTINARDAMDGHGTLTVRLANAVLDAEYAASHEEVAPGEYVMFALTDTGSGMPPEVIEKVFEPFFTTKPEHKGTGLGLSMVYGFVKQSGGHVNIESEVGVGTTIRLYLPRAKAVAVAEPAADDGPVVGGSETVLVVEDDPDVRAAAVDMLKGLGYRVLKAADAEGGLAIVESGLPIDLLFSDVIMPGELCAADLAKQAREHLPGIAVLFTSGYTENAICVEGRLDKGTHLLTKPYTREALARKVRKVLDARKADTPLAERPLSILLVEDDATIRAYTAELLASAGHVVHEAGSGEHALPLLERDLVDVLVTDMNLPGMSGRMLARRAREIRSQTGIIFATGDGHPADGADGAAVLHKPYRLSALAEAVRSVAAPA